MKTEKETLYNEIAVDLVGVERYVARMIDKLRHDSRDLAEDNILSNLISLKASTELAIRNITNIVPLDEDIV